MITPTSKVTKLYFLSSATNQTVEGCDLVATITHNLHTEQSLNQMMSLAIAAYMSGKKIRAHSSSNNCELDFLALQESRF